MKNFADYEKIINVDISKLKPHPKNEKLLPRLTRGELKRLKDRIQKYGFNEPIEITKSGLVLDGNNRIFKILIPFKDELQIEKVPARVVNIPVEQEADYIISKNFDRRQLSKLMQSYIRGQQYNEAKKTGFKGNQYNKSGSGQNVLKQKTSKEIAYKFGMAERTIRRDGGFAKLCDDLILLTDYDFVFNLLNGEIHANKSLITKLSKQPNEFIAKIHNYYKTADEFEPLKDVFEKFSKNEKPENEKEEKFEFIFEIDASLKKKLEELSKKTGVGKEELAKKIFEFGLKNFE